MFGLTPKSTRSSFVGSVGLRSAKIRAERPNEIRHRLRHLVCAASYDAYIYCDGSSRENVCGLGAVVRFPNSDEYRFASRRLEDTQLTSMEVEYYAIDFALRFADSIFDYYPRVLVLSDQVNVIKQLKDEQNVSKQSLQELRQEVYDWDDYFNGIYYQWVSRKNNKLANEYARKASSDDWTTYDFEQDADDDTNDDDYDDDWDE